MFDEDENEFEITTTFEKMTIARLLIDVLICLTLLVVNLVLDNWAGVLAAGVGTAELAVAMNTLDPDKIMFHLMMSSIMLLVSVGSMFLFI